MSISFKLLFQTTVSHEYEGPDGKVALELVPTDQTRQIMQQLDLREKPINNGLEVYYGTRDERAAALFGPEDPIRLIFRLVPQEPDFINYTDLPPATISDAPLLLTNLAGNGELVTVEEKDDEEDGEENKEEDADDDDEVSPLTSLQSGDIGLVSIYIGDTGEDGVYLLENETVTPAEYAIAFSARATKWQYFLVAKGTIADPVITDSATTETVSAPPSITTLGNGQEAIAVPLSAPRKLYRRPPDHLLLNCQLDGQNISLRLPSPDAQRLLAPEPPGDPVFRSDLYVYL